LLWQSSSAPAIPPFRIPSNAWWCGWGRHSETTSSPSTKLLIRSPFSFAGPHPKQRLFGAYVS
jgi:hypothetical protein